MDGDGTDDIVLRTEENQVLLVSGADVASGAVDIVEVAALVVTPAVREEPLWYLSAPRLRGDLNDDGYGEMVVAGQDARTECADDCEELLYFSGEQRGSLDSVDARGSYLSFPTADFTLPSAARSPMAMGTGTYSLHGTSIRLGATKCAPTSSSASTSPGTIPPPGNQGTSHASSPRPRLPLSLPCRRHGAPAPGAARSSGPRHRPRAKYAPRERLSAGCRAPGRREAVRGRVRAVRRGHPVR